MAGSKSFRAKTYKNRKEEERVQVSGLQADFQKLLDEDEDAQKSFDDAVAEAIRK